MEAAFTVARALLLVVVGLFAAGFTVWAFQLAYGLVIWAALLMLVLPKWMRWILVIPVFWASGVALILIFNAVFWVGGWFSGSFVGTAWVWVATFFQALTVPAALVGITSVVAPSGRRWVALLSMLAVWIWLLGTFVDPATGNLDFSGFPAWYYLAYGVAALSAAYNALKIATLEPALRALEDESEWGRRRAVAPQRPPERSSDNRRRVKLRIFAYELGRIWAIIAALLVLLLVVMWMNAGHGFVGILSGAATNALVFVGPGLLLMRWGWTAHEWGDLGTRDDAAHSDSVPSVRRSTDVPLFTRLAKRMGRAGLLLTIGGGVLLGAWVGATLAVGSALPIPVARYDPGGLGANLAVFCGPGLLLLVGALLVRMVGWLGDGLARVPTMWRSFRTGPLDDVGPRDREVRETEGTRVTSERGRHRGVASAWREMWARVPDGTSRAQIVASLAAATMLVVAVGEWPYGYYTLLRLGVTAVAGYLTMSAYRREQLWPAILFAAVALLFNPFVVVEFERETWVWIGLVSAVLFLGRAVFVLESPHGGPRLRSRMVLLGLGGSVALGGIATVALYATESGPFSSGPSFGGRVATGSALRRPSFTLRRPGFQARPTSQSLTGLTRTPRPTAPTSTPTMTASARLRAFVPYTPRPTSTPAPPMPTSTPSCIGTYLPSSGLVRCYTPVPSRVTTSSTPRPTATRTSDPWLTESAEFNFPGAYTIRHPSTWSVEGSEELVVLRDADSSSTVTVRRLSLGERDAPCQRHDATARVVTVRTTGSTKSAKGCLITWSDETTSFAELTTFGFEVRGSAPLEDSSRIQTVARVVGSFTPAT